MYAIRSYYEFDAAEVRLSETFVYWNRPHKVTVGMKYILKLHHLVDDIV